MQSRLFVFDAHETSMAKKNIFYFVSLLYTKKGFETSLENLLWEMV